MNPGTKEALCEALHSLGSCDVTVAGRSMWPFIRPGDVVTIAAGPLNIRRGTVVAFFSENQLIVHRVVGYRKRPDGLQDCVVHGDSSPGSRAVIAQDQVIGCVTAIKRNSRKTAIWLRPPLSWIAIVAGFVLQAAVTLSNRRAA